MPIPIRKILDKNINRVDTPAIHSILTKAKKHAQWTANIKHEADLVERVWQRTRMFNIQIKNRNGNPDISYLRMLNIALNQALEDN